jgi:murein DD-endopeptidase MepM/ murein hydrolase activator NlpD
MAKATTRDISFYNAITSWATFKANTDMVILRTSQKDWEDRSFRSHWAGARSVAMRIGLYHFMHPDFDGHIQAHFFAQLYKSLGVKIRFVALDCEAVDYWDRTDPQNPVHVQIYPTSKEEYTFWIMQWLSSTEQDLGIIPLIYTSQGFWDYYVIRSNTKFMYNGVEYTTPDWSRHPLWVANYDVLVPNLPKDWKTWIMWQNTANLIAGASGNIDHNYVNGTVADLDIFLGETPPPPVDYSKVKLSWPCDPKWPINQRFGEHPEWYGPYGLPGHEGIDFAVPLNQPIFSMLDGIVEFVKPNGGAYGNYVVVRHENSGVVLHTYYCHLNSIQVAEGQGVKQGQTVGLSGSTGNSTGPHLHITVKVDGVTSNYPVGIIDPYNLLVPTVPVVIPTKLVMKVNDVRIRLTPGTSGKILGYVGAGDALPLAGDSEIDLNGYHWDCVKVWVSRGTDSIIYGTLQ